ncbi:MAG TPA: putative glycoside hydrolase [Gaiellales bacterium]|nr:putative glycoside hydrolase [Gaiellales bacterium]
MAVLLVGLLFAGAAGATSPPGPQASRLPAPAHLQVEARTRNSIAVSWRRVPSAWTYGVRRNGRLVAVTRRERHTYHGLACGTGYRLEIVARRGVRRSRPATMTVRTMPCPPMPAQLTAAPAGSDSVQLSWTGTGAAYEVFVDGVKRSSTTSTGDTVAPLACGRSYTVGVVELDDAGNRSAMATAAAATGPCPPPVAGQASLFSRVVHGYTSPNGLSISEEAGRYGVMVMNTYDSATVTALKAANPGLKIFMYVDMMSSDPTDPTGIADWVGYTDACAHPDWFLQDADGRRLIFQSYPSSRVMDVGNQAYQDAGIAHVVAMARAAGFDGVFLDDANASLRWVVAGGSSASVSYPTDAAWQAAVYSFFTRVAPQLHAAGLQVVANIGGSTVTPGLWQKWNTPLDGAMEESWTDGGEGLGQQVPDWSAKLANVAWSEANGKYAILNSYNTTEAGNTYGLASMLLVAGGWSSYDTANSRYQSETWYPEYDTAAQLGEPLGGYTVLPDGVYRRDFANGVVLVNPSTSPVDAVEPGVSLGPTSGAILPR